MAELFTTFESVSPPDIVTPDVQLNYQEIQLMQLPTLEIEDSDIDWSFLDTPLLDVQEPIFNYPPFKSLNTSSIALRVIKQARLFLGSKYSWGGSSPNSGFDCSGLIKYVFGKIGINLPRTAALQGKIGQEISLQLALPGDVIWFGSKNSPSGQHIGLISKIDNGLIYIIDAAGKKLGVTERALPNLLIKSVRRLIGNLGGNFEQLVLNFFLGKGLSEHLARGILGNLMQESRGNHTITNKTSGAFGLAQWLGPRKQKLMLRYGSNPTILQLLEFIWEELNTSENKAFLKLLNTNTIADATRAFALHFERASKNEMNMNKRIKFAYLA